MAKAAKKKAKGAKKPKDAEPYVHRGVTAPMRPDVGTQPQFRKKKPPKTYRYDSSLSPAPDRRQGIHDGGNELLVMKPLQQ